MTVCKTYVIPGLHALTGSGPSIEDYRVTFYLTLRSTRALQPSTTYVLCFNRTFINILFLPSLWTH